MIKLILCVAHHLVNLRNNAELDCQLNFLETEMDTDGNRHKIHKRFVLIVNVVEVHAVKSMTNANIQEKEVY